MDDMLGELDMAAIEEVLRSETVARLGCIANGWPYIVPVSYVYDGEFVYGHSDEGLKLRAMRENPRVCLEVEQLRSVTNWRTVVLRGLFEQLSSEDEERAVGLFTARLGRVDTSANARLTMQEEVERQEGIRRPIPFRVRVEERTGRFELM
jgi:nitroimidazol reductase NimA-like FMN-containing flavoprotein (pyridoxamine 5'-phosphate oxidase superfamily)